MSETHEEKMARFRGEVYATTRPRVFAELADYADEIQAQLVQEREAFRVMNEERNRRLVELFDLRSKLESLEATPFMRVFLAVLPYNLNRAEGLEPNEDKRRTRAIDDAFRCAKEASAASRAMRRSGKRPRSKLTPEQTERLDGLVSFATGKYGAAAASYTTVTLPMDVFLVLVQNLPEECLAADLRVARREAQRISVARALAERINSRPAQGETPHVEDS